MFFISNKYQKLTIKFNLYYSSDGCGRTGTYALMDMVLNRMAKGKQANLFLMNLELCHLFLSNQSINMGAI